MDVRNLEGKEKKQRIPSVPGEFRYIVTALLLLIMLTGCATSSRTSLNPPPGLKRDLDSLRDDDTIRRPGKSTKYTIQKGDTIWRIAYDHGVPPDDIIRINKIKDVSNIKPGQILIIPEGISGKKTVRVQNPESSGNQSHESFIWPVHGKILYGFDSWIDGYKNTGIDIQAIEGQAVKASKSGIVALTSDTPDGWGKVIVLQHDDGSYTWYAYNSKILVEKGDRIKQGQTISTAGRTGKAEQDTLHFKIFLHGVPVNPTYHLP